MASPPGRADPVSPPVDPPEPERTLSDLVGTVAVQLRAAWREGLAPWGLSPHQGRAILVVGGEPGLRSADLASRLRISPRSVTEVVDRLSEAGLVERQPDPRDRRAMTLHLTADGSRTVEAIRGSREEVAEELFSVLSDRDRAQLRRILTTVAGSSGRTHPSGAWPRG